MPKDGRFAGRVALVTGAGSGNGAAIARRLADEGAEVVLLDRRPDGLEEVLASWPAKARERSRPVTADITHEDEIAAVFAGLEQLDILVNNAGIVDPGTFPELDTEGFEHVLDVNLLGPYRCTRAAYELLCASDAGRVINITSMEAHWLLVHGRARPAPLQRLEGGPRPDDSRTRVRVRLRGGYGERDRARGSSRRR